MSLQRGHTSFKQLAGASDDGPVEPGVWLELDHPHASSTALSSKMAAIRANLEELGCQVIRKGTLVLVKVADGAPPTRRRSTPTKVDVDGGGPS